MGTHFLVRTCVDRLAGDGRHTVPEEMKPTVVGGLHRIEVRNRRGDSSTAQTSNPLSSHAGSPSIGKQKQYPELVLTAIHPQEKDVPKDGERIDWKLLTDLPVRSCQEAVEKLGWYAQRWEIETFHKILKSGSKVEDAKLVQPSAS